MMNTATDVSSGIPNPITKRHLPRIEGVNGAFIAILSGWRPWVDICPECGHRVQGGSRKVAKDLLHCHRKTVHA
jgi:hypothetical protein